MTSLVNLIYGKSSVEKRKRKILEEADRDIQKLQRSKTDRTKQVEKESGVESDVQKAIRERGKKARKDLTLLTGKK